MSDNLKKTLSDLHLKLAQDLLNRVESGEATTADLSVARQFLKDNGVDSTVKVNKPMLNLAEIMPFDPDEEEAA
jgi:hypothetical protein